MYRTGAIPVLELKTSKNFETFHCVTSPKLKNVLHLFFQRYESFLEPAINYYLMSHKMKTTRGKEVPVTIKAFILKRNSYQKQYQFLFILFPESQVKNLENSMTHPLSTV